MLITESRFSVTSVVTSLHAKTCDTDVLFLTSSIDVYDWFCAVSSNIPKCLGQVHPEAVHDDLIAVSTASRDIPIQVLVLGLCLLLGWCYHHIRRWLISPGQFRAPADDVVVQHRQLHQPCFQVLLPNHLYQHL